MTIRRDAGGSASGGISSRPTKFARGDWYVGIVRVESADKQVGIAGITRELDTLAH
jgi:hypothetical protein